MKRGKSQAGKHILKLGYQRLVFLLERVFFIDMQFINTKCTKTCKEDVWEENTSIPPQKVITLILF